MKTAQPLKRPYRSDLRASQAEATRQAILKAAGRLCRTGGWPDVTIAAIAKEAGVSKETIYAVFGTKVALIGEMVKAHVAHAPPGQHFLDEARPSAIRAETCQARQIDLWATYLSEIMERVSPLMAVVRAGSEAEPAMGELYRALHAGRRANLSSIAQSIANQGSLRNGQSAEDATELLWQFASPEMFDLLINVAGYSVEQYADWLAGVLRSTLLKA